jgi:CheY-like chemotaxis protein
MSFHALIVTRDETAAGALKQVLSGFGLGVQACPHSGALARLRGQKFDAVVVDFDDPATATLVLQHAHQASSGTAAITAALLSDRGRVRDAFGAGANFVLYKPVSVETAEASLRAAIALIKRERRRSLRVPVQFPVWLRLPEGESEIEGILLTLSDNGMEVVASQPLSAAVLIGFRFSLPGGASEITGNAEIAWANANGQTGARFNGLADEMRGAIAKWIMANAQFLPNDTVEPVSQCRLTDLSVGGCYVETESPFPERMGIVLSLRAERLEVQAEGVVRVMHPGIGMGIEFASHTRQQRDQVHEFIEFLTSRPGTAPALYVVPSTLTANEICDPQDPHASEYEDPLLDLLHRHESLTQEEFLEELRQQRNSAEVAR